MTKPQVLWVGCLFVGVAILLFLLAPSTPMQHYNSTMRLEGATDSTETDLLDDNENNETDTQDEETGNLINLNYSIYVDGRIIRSLSPSEQADFPTEVATDEVGNQNFDVPTFEEEKYQFLGWFVSIGDSVPTQLSTRQIETKSYYYIDTTAIDLTNVTEINLLAKVGSVTINYQLYLDETVNRAFDDSERQGLIDSYTISDIKDIMFEVPTLSDVGKYNFLGWTLRIDANNQYNLARRSVGENVYYYIPSNIALSIELRSITMVARVEIAVYKITYRGLRGGSAPDVTSYTKSSETYIDFSSQEMIPTLTGYKFEGWFADSSLTIPAPLITPSSYGDVTVYAKCTEIWFEIKYVNANYEDELVRYGDNAAERLRNKHPEREGYRFDGWFLNENLTRIVDDYYIAEGEEGKVITFYAKWDKVAGPVIYWIVGAFVVLTLASLGAWWAFFRPEKEK